MVDLELVSHGWNLKRNTSVLNWLNTVRLNADIYKKVLGENP